MAFSNVSITDTYNLWRTRHNQLVVWANALDAANVINFVSNTAALTIAGSSLKLGTVYFSIVSTTNTDDTSTSNVASASLANTIYQYARAQATNGNNAYTLANNAYIFANTVLNTAQGAFDKANLAAPLAAYTQANTALTTAQGAFAQANTAASLSTNGIVEIATTAEYLRGTDQVRVLSVSETWNSAAEVSLTDAATIVLDFATFINANVTLGGNRTLGNPSNVKTGQTGSIRIKQDGVGGRTLSYASSWEFAQGTAPTLSTPASNTDILFYYAYGPTSIYGSLIKGIR